jgi:hypothetical protein
MNKEEFIEVLRKAILKMEDECGYRYPTAEEQDAMDTGRNLIKLLEN